jgi:hypothetical protein
MSESFLDQEFQEYNDDRIAELTKERDEWKQVVGWFMDAMGGDTKGKPPWEKVADWRSLVVRVASIHDGKPHNKWVRQLGVEARRILGKESK